MIEVDIPAVPDKTVGIRVAVGSQSSSVHYLTLEPPVITGIELAAVELQSDGTQRLTISVLGSSFGCVPRRRC